MGAGRRLLFDSGPLRAFLERHCRFEGRDLLPFRDLPVSVSDRAIARIPAVEGIMANDWIKTRQTKYGAYVALYVIVILCVVFAANYLAKNHNKTLDVTSNKQFTLSDQTKKVVGEL